MNIKIVVAIIALAFILAGTVCAGSEKDSKEMGKAAGSDTLYNIGFMKNPPKN